MMENLFYERLPKLQEVFFFFFQNIKWEKAIGKPVTSKINLILILGLSLS